jgi:cobalt-zinc-cadmium efflux system outer membrane protein
MTIRFVCATVRRLAPLVLLISLAAGAATAEEAEPHGELTLAQAVGAALTRNPELQSAEYELRAADARTLQAGLRPNPELSVEFENFAGTHDAQGTHALGTTLSLSQVVELGGKRERRVEVAERNRDRIALERQIRQLDVLAEVTRRFVEVVAAQERMALAKRATELSERTLAAIAARVAAARSPEAEQSRAAIALARAQLEQQRAEHELLGSRRMLAALWASTEPDFDTARADLYAMPSVEGFEALAQRLQNNPDFLSFAAESRLREAELRLAQAQARPSLQWSAGIRRLQDASDPDRHDMALVAGFSLSLPLSDRNQGAIRESQIRQEQVPVDQRAASIKANATLFDLYQTLQQARLEAQALHGQIIPQAQQALAQTDYGFQRGRFSYLELANAQLELIELERAAIDAATTYHRLVAEMERLTNEPLSSEPSGEGSTDRGTRP